MILTHVMKKMIFDLDPYIYSGVENKVQEPEYNLKAFKATVDVAYNLKELFDELKIESYVKTSGKTGLHIFVPVATFYTYEQTRKEDTHKKLQWNGILLKGKERYSLTIIRMLGEKQ